MKVIVAVVRTVAALSGIVAIAATFFDTATRATINPFNFFGFFTIQSNIIFLVVIAATAFLSLSGRPSPGWLELARGAATTYMVIVGAVYNTLLIGLEGGVALPWANTVVHLILPVYALVDWVLVADRRPLPWSRLWTPLIYPVIWLIVVLIRGATDGWVPYPFLDPSIGYGAIALYAIAIAVATIVVAVAVWGLSRLRIIRVDRELSRTVGRARP